MDVTTAIERRLEVREFADRPVAPATKRSILDAARSAPSGKNLQHWHFILVDDDPDLDRLADLSTTGDWVAGADFAVVVCTDPDYYYHEIDAGRAISYLQFGAAARGVGSCIYTGFDAVGMRELLGVPDSLAVTAVVGCGYPSGSGLGRKSRVPMDAVVSHGRFDRPLNLAD